MTDQERRAELDAIAAAARARACGSDVVTLNKEEITRVAQLEGWPEKKVAWYRKRGLID